MYLRSSDSTNQSAPDGPAIPAQRTVGKATVHKSADAENLLTDSRRLGETRFAVGAWWPRNHFLSHRPGQPSADPVLLVETVRQAAIHLSHRYFDVPLDAPFVMFDLEFRTDGSGLPGGGRAGLPVALDVTCVRDPDSRARCRLALDAEILVEGRRCGRMTVRWEAMAPRLYAALRRRGMAQAAEHPAPEWPVLTPVTAGALGDGEPRDIVLGTTGALPEGSWGLRLDRGHPVLFDHEADHVQGMALVEALRQAACLTAGSAAESGRVWVPTAGKVAFPSFAELGQGVVVGATLTSGVAGPTVHAAATQGDRTVAAAMFRGAWQGAGRSGGHRAPIGTGSVATC